MRKFRKIFQTWSKKTPLWHTSSQARWRLHKSRRHGYRLSTHLLRISSHRTHPSHNRCSPRLPLHKPQSLLQREHLLPGSWQVLKSSQLLRFKTTIILEYFAWLKTLHIDKYFFYHTKPIKASNEAKLSLMHANISWNQIMQMMVSSRHPGLSQGCIIVHRRADCRFSPFSA